MAQMPHQYLSTLTARQHNALQTELANYQLRLFQEALIGIRTFKNGVQCGTQ